MFPPTLLSATANLEPSTNGRRPKITPLPGHYSGDETVELEVMTESRVDPMKELSRLFVFPELAK